MYHAVEKHAWLLQQNNGVSRIGLDGTLYDQVLDATFILGLAPSRFQVSDCICNHATYPWPTMHDRCCACISLCSHLTTLPQLANLCPAMAVVAVLLLFKTRIVPLLSRV